MKELIDLTDYPSFDVEAVNQTFMEWEHHKAENIMGFRDNAYKSIMTGKMSPKHHTPWLKAMEDSLESYLNESRETPRARRPRASPRRSDAEPSRGLQPQGNRRRNRMPFKVLLIARL